LLKRLAEIVTRIIARKPAGMTSLAGGSALARVGSGGLAFATRVFGGLCMNRFDPGSSARRTARHLSRVALILALAAAPALSHAQDVGKPVAADFKGAVGFGLIGAELGGVIPALAGVNAAWAYILFPVVGAAGGAVGGYYLLDHAGHAELSVVALTAGMALVIPALVATLALNTYDPQQESRETSQNGRRLERARARQLRAAAAGAGMLRVERGELALATPGIALLPGHAAGGQLRLSGVNVALFSGEF
jgi:hypothetical protein